MPKHDVCGNCKHFVGMHGALHCTVGKCECKEIVSIEMFRMMKAMGVTRR